MARGRVHLRCCSSMGTHACAAGVGVSSEPAAGLMASAAVVPRESLVPVNQERSADGEHRKADAGGGADPCIPRVESVRRDANDLHPRLMRSGGVTGRRPASASAAEASAASASVSASVCLVGWSDVTAASPGVGWPAPHSRWGQESTRRTSRIPLLEERRRCDVSRFSDQDLRGRGLCLAGLLVGRDLVVEGLKKVQGRR